MNRYISEHQVSTEGTVISLPIGSLFKSVTKVSNYFLLAVEVFADQTVKRVELEIVIKKRNTYIHPKAKFISSVLVGSELLHFFAQPVGVEDGADSVGLTRQTNPEAPPPQEV